MPITRDPPAFKFEAQPVVFRARPRVPKPRVAHRHKPIHGSEGLWRFTEHCCASCFGRILESEDHTTFRCAVCGSTADTLHAVCCCGMRFPNHRRDGSVGQGKSIGLKCVPNPRRSGMSPAEIVATEYNR